MTLQDVYDDLLSARRKLDAYNIGGHDKFVVEFVSRAISKAMREIDRRAAIDFFFAK